MNLVDRERLKILGGDKPWFVGTVDATGQEERFVMFHGKLLANPLGDQPVATKLLVGGIQRGPVRFHVLPGFTGEADRPLFRVEGPRERVLGLFFWEILVPGTGVNKVVQHFPGARCTVPVVSEVLWQDDGIWQDLAHLLVVGVKSRAVRREAGHDRCTGGVACGAGAMGVGKQHPAFCQAIEVGCDRLGMSPQATDPVVEIVHGDEQDIRPLGSVECPCRQKAPGDGQ